MDRRKKVALATLVIVAGVALALQFRKPQTATPPSPAWPTASQPSDDHRATAHTGTSTPRDGKIDPTHAQPSAVASPLAGTGPEPSAAAPDPLRNPLRQKTDSSSPSGASLFNPMRSMAPAARTEVGPLEPLVDVNAPERTHKVVDGDTLTKLSARYLGRAERYLELYEYNRDVLRNPEILPIGAELRIPKHVVVPVAGEPAAPSVAPPAPLVPVTAAPSAAPLSSLAPGTAAGAPSTRLTPTTPAAPVAARRAEPRKYTVQPGDNLVDIARKLYGDGRRHEDLFEANRRTLRTPTDLKPGVVLVVP